MVTERGSSARRQLSGGPAAMGTVELKNGADAVAINLLLIVRPERKGQRDGLTDGAGLKDDGNGNSRPQPPPKRDFSGQQAPKELHKQKQTVTSYTNEGTHVTVEIHPKGTSPQFFKKLSFGKGPRRLPSLRGQDNKAFERTEAPRPPSAKDLHVYPWDKSSLKSLAVDLQKFEKLDAYALKVNTKSSVEELVQTLLKQARTDLEKVRVIWMWICHHIEYDVVGFHNKSLRLCEPTDVLRTGKSVCEGYAGLFQQMCSFAGIQCMKLSGYSKGYGYKIGQTFQGNSDHAWNAVYLDGRWHLLDSTWGSGTVDDTSTKFTYRYNEFYFLTHPALFVNNHFPDNSNWQLLKPTLTLKQFESNLQHNSDFYKLGLLDAHPQTALIQTENGAATISVECRPSTLFTFKLEGTDEHGLLTLRKQGMKLEIYPQKTGRQELQIFARPSKSTEDVYTCVLEYIVECKSVDKSRRFPKDLHQPVGPSWFTEKQGFLRPSHPDPIIHTNDGRCSLTFTMGKDISILTSLHADSSSLSEEMSRQHIMQIHRGNQVEFKVHLPHAGSFVLKFFTKKKSDPGSYTFVFNYLITCLNTEVKWPAFPLRYSRWAEGYELLEPLSRLLPANRNVQFKLKMQGISKVLVQAGDTYTLTLSRDGFWEGTCNTAGCTELFVMVHENANHGYYSHILKYDVETQ
ncbi:kyphoscoliosis peptidase isoform X1 [Tympanuchus pallidicinctus]|uniref:kyphoscoliosis peptidase isoform X1 n=1 Tax=Tympanuchus pallidicinctus TaxID=109042 RepID=UPI002287598B|nr:kyphoscoliosis peptidase isoform X1 [Tympanuchus pallidicinctus]